MTQYLLMFYPSHYRRFDTVHITSYEDVIDICRIAKNSGATHIANVINLNHKTNVILYDTSTFQQIRGVSDVTDLKQQFPFYQ